MLDDDINRRTNQMTDPIADMLTRIRNANTSKHDTVDVPASKMKMLLLKSFIKKASSRNTNLLKMAISKYPYYIKIWKDKNEKIITGLKRISKPGLRFM